MPYIVENTVCLTHGSICKRNVYLSLIRTNGVKRPDGGQKKLLECIAPTIVFSSFMLSSANIRWGELSQEDFVCSLMTQNTQMVALAAETSTVWQPDSLLSFLSAALLTHNRPSCSILSMRQAYIEILKCRWYKAFSHVSEFNGRI